MLGQLDQILQHVVEIVSNMSVILQAHKSLYGWVKLILLKLRVLQRDKLQLKILDTLFVLIQSASVLMKEKSIVRGIAWVNGAVLAIHATVFLVGQVMLALKV